jgi:hypothetical protein
MTKPVVLFILKRRPDFNLDLHNTKSMSTGLYNSAAFMADMCNASGIDAHIEVAIDNNCIDRLVTQHRPTHVIIEALWVVPSKFTILTKLHPTVKWIVRLHSEMPFLASEGMALDWIGDYSSIPNVIVAANGPRMLGEVSLYLKVKQGWTDTEAKEKVIYLPNYYPQDYKQKEYQINKEYIDIGCFGAVRPLKNHVLQAIAAIQFAEKIGKKLNFHINVGRVEGKGEPVMSNLQGLFKQLYEKGHRLISNTWAPREEFLQLCAKMDIGLQVSFSETFNIVGADIISQGVPLVGSIEIPWCLEEYTARAQYCEEIYNALIKTHENPLHNVEGNQKRLTEYTSNTDKIWTSYFKGE